MIRKLLNGDIDRVADIWLKTNLKAHYFISNQYWKSNYELVKEMMSQSEVYVYEDDKMIQGFVGLNAEYIEGISVSDDLFTKEKGSLFNVKIWMKILVKKSTLCYGNENRNYGATASIFLSRSSSK